jgi:hypothetical protein
MSWQRMMTMVASQVTLAILLAGLVATLGVTQFARADIIDQLGKAHPGESFHFDVKKDGTNIGHHPHLFRNQN